MLGICKVSKEMEILFLERILFFTIEKRIRKWMSIPCDYGRNARLGTDHKLALIKHSLKRKDGLHRCGVPNLEEYVVELAY